MEDRRSLPPYEDELSLALLRSADRDEPSAAAYSKAANALGVSAAVGLGVALPAQAALLSNAAAGAGIARFTSSLFGKVVVVGLSGALLVVGGVALLAQREPARVGASAKQRAGNAAPLASERPKTSASTSGRAEPSPSESAALANAASAPTPTSPIRPQVPAAGLPAPVKSAASLGARGVAPVSAARVAKASSLPEQVMSLDRARVALDSGDAGGALAEIAHYRSMWPRGVFLEEASVLEIEALAKRGEIVLAGMRAQAYVTAHPDSPQAGRLRALIPGHSR